MCKKTAINNILLDIIDKAKDARYSKLKSVMTAHYPMTIRTNIPYLFESANNILNLVGKKNKYDTIYDIVKNISDSYDVEIPIGKAKEIPNRASKITKVITKFIQDVELADDSEDYREPLIDFIHGYFEVENTIISTIFRDLFNMLVLCYWEYSGHATEPFIKIKYSKIRKSTKYNIAGCKGYSANIDYTVQVLNWDNRQPERVADKKIQNREEFYRKSIIRKYTGIDRDLFLCDAMSEWERESYQDYLLRDRLEKAIGFDERKDIVLTRVANLIIYLWSQIELGLSTYFWTDRKSHFTDALWAAFRLDKYKENNYKFIGEPSEEEKEKMKSYFYRIVKNLPNTRVESLDNAVLMHYLNEANANGYRLLFDIVLAKCVWNSTASSSVLKEVVDID